VYDSLDPDIACRIATGTAPEEAQGPVLHFQEFPSDIFDSFTQPRPFIDSAKAGEGTLKIRKIAPDLGELYWG
jgi:hypothetical protein